MVIKVYFFYGTSYIDSFGLLSKILVEIYFKRY